LRTDRPIVANTQTLFRRRKANPATARPEVERSDGRGGTLSTRKDSPSRDLPVALFKKTWVPRHMLNPVRLLHAAGAHARSGNMSRRVSTVPPTADTDVEVDLWAM
jgi:hypothetical protein